MNTTQPTWIPINEKVRRRTIVVGEQMMQMLVEFQKDGQTPEHKHVHDQVLHVIRGRMKLTIAGKDQLIPAGQSCYLPSNVPHAAAALEDSLVLDTFHPIREDLIAQDKQR